MPALKRLVISGIRNIEAGSLEPGPSFNLIYGNNGSGKTSILEAVHFLSLGRSFRTHQHKPLIRDGCHEAVVFGETVEGISIGVSRTPRRGDSAQLRLNGSKVDSLAVLAHELPVQLLNSDAFLIIEGGPQERRECLDWGVFHVKHQFLPAWRSAKRALINRNALLKRQASSAEIEPWTHELATHALTVDRLRREYLDELTACLGRGLGQELAQKLGVALDVEYTCGWDESKGLFEQLNDDLDKERRYGHTLYGPHRADLGFRVDGKPCVDVLSRGQMKLCIGFLKIAQAQLLMEANGKSCVFLVDDLPAELDRDNQSALCRHLAILGVQVFVTSIEPEPIAALEPLTAARLFHVKHGKISTL